MNADLESVPKLLFQFWHFWQSWHSWQFCKPLAKKREQKFKRQPPYAPMQITFSIMAILAFLAILAIL